MELIEIVQHNCRDRSEEIQQPFVTRFIQLLQQGEAEGHRVDPEFFHAVQLTPVEHLPEGIQTYRLLPPQLEPDISTIPQKSPLGVAGTDQLLQAGVRQ